MNDITKKQIEDALEPFENADLHYDAALAAITRLRVMWDADVSFIEQEYIARDINGTIEKLKELRNELLKATGTATKGAQSNRIAIKPPVTPWNPTHYADDDDRRTT
jgi:hypothetical protein